ncbi:hypothetical protein [uncultured Tateyamaria sp.]|uniref:hypothetical protein n=1 Tax=uncultured Tateyamaria sp. TaxID=455651 RepID=UPI002639F0B9|nr:hypothetical protein [uncultured Tateyamaria sp.]
MIFFGQRKNDTLDFALPALAQPELPVPPSKRIMEVASLRSWAYGLFVANALSLLFMGGFYALLLWRIDEVAYVADGSSYGCSPATSEISPVEPQREIPPRRPVFEPLAPIEG